MFPHVSRITFHVSRSHIEPSPPARSKRVSFRAELDCALRLALKNVRHDSNAAGKFNCNLRDMFLQRGNLAEYRNRSTRSTACNLSAVQTSSRPALAHRFDQEIHIRHRQMAVSSIA